MFLLIVILWFKFCIVGLKWWLYRYSFWLVLSFFENSLFSFWGNMMVNVEDVLIVLFILLYCLSLWCVFVRFCIGFGNFLIVGLVFFVFMLVFVWFFSLCFYEVKCGFDFLLFIDMMIFVLILWFFLDSFVFFCDILIKIG